MPLAGRIVFQMDQAASTDQVILWDLGERAEDTNLDRNIRVCLSGNPVKTMKLRSEYVYHSSNIECNSVRKATD